MVDLSFLKQFTKGNPDKMKRYISMYLDNSPKIFRDMETYLNNMDWEQLRISAHSLKPQTEFMGAHQLKDKLIEIENAINNQNDSNLETLFKLAKELHIESQKYLKGQLQKLH